MPSAPSERPLFLDPNLNIIFSVTLLAVLGVSSIAPVFPTVARELGVSPEAVGLLITVFTMPGILLTPFFGILADRFGRKKVLVPALLLFSLAGSSCSLARDFEVLLLLRFLQGVGAASLGSLNATLIGDLFTGRRRTEAMGYNASVLSIGTAVYPSLGGALAALGWYVPFALPIVGLAVAFAVLFRLDSVEVEPGNGLGRYLRDALAGMKNRKVIGLYLVSVMTFIVLYGAYTTFIPLHLSERFGSTAFAIGLIMSVGSLSTAITASGLRYLARHTTSERLITYAFALYGVSFAAIPMLPGHWLVALPVALFGVAQGMNYPVVMSLLAGLAPTEHRAIFMSANGMVLRVGQTLGPLIMAAVFAWGGMARVFHVAAGICIAMFLSLPLLIGRK
ncbi:MAG: MFS transporter [Gemmatimonadetes bacterium]|nr:MFS transporter [Gemmatimonadota bacterium]